MLDFVEENRPAAGRKRPHSISSEEEQSHKPPLRNQKRDMKYRPYTQSADKPRRSHPDDVSSNSGGTPPREEANSDGTTKVLLREGPDAVCNLSKACSTRRLRR